MKDLIFFSMVRWDTIWQRPQHLALELSKFFRILYVDPIAYSVLGAIRNHLIGDHTRNFHSKLTKINDNLSIYTPKPFLPFSEDFWFINQIDHELLFYFISKILSKIGFSDPILLSNNPYHLPILNKISNSLVCYDCMDDYSYFFKSQSRRSRLICEKENELISQAQVIITTSENLFKRFSKRNVNVHLVRNGVTDLFLNYSKKLDSNYLPDFPLGDGPIIGYMGTISHWFDCNAIRNIAIKHPDWKIILLGPVQIEVNSLKKIKNVYFLGRKDYYLLPAYVERFDVATIPFKINKLTNAVNPVKIYEYFALGKPVVASRLPELTEFEDICYLANDTNDFLSKVELALIEIEGYDLASLSTLKIKRRNIALENTWEQRASSIYSMICRNL